MMCSPVLVDSKEGRGGGGRGDKSGRHQDTPPPCPTPSPAQAQPPSSTPPSPSSSEHPDIAFWRERIQDWYPSWLGRTYFIPPVLLCKTLSDTAQVCGQTVQIPQPPTVGPTGPRRKSQPPALLASDVIEDQTQQRILHCIRKLSRCQGDVMFVLSQLRYEDYLSEPCFQAAAKTLPRPVDLVDAGKHRGDFDLLIIHRHYGILVCEIKSVGAQFSSSPELTDQQKANIVVGRVVSGMKQLRKSEDVLQHLVSDLSPRAPRVRTCLVLPNVTSAQLREILWKSPGVSRDLCQCLGIDGNRDPVDLCLTADRVSDASTPYDVNIDVIDQLRQWWRVRMTSDGVDQAMTDSTYLELLARFSGPATSVRVFCALRPRLHMDVVRTEGEGVSETGRRFTQIMLTPFQQALQNSHEPLVALTGPPGTGKSLMLLLKALDWLREGWHVHIVSTWHQSLAMSLHIAHQLERTLGAGAVKGRVHLLELDLLKGGQEVERGVWALLQASRERLAAGQPLCVVLDEACEGSHLQTFCHTLLTSTTSLLLHSSSSSSSSAAAGNDDNSLPPPPPPLHDLLPLLRLWVVCMHHDRLPSLLVEIPLTHPLRSPPSVVREVELSCSFRRGGGGSVYGYTAPASPLPSDGCPTLYLWHSGKGHEGHAEIRHCAQCGRDVAALLRRELHVGVQVAGRPRGTPKAPPPLQFSDVFVLSYFALNEANGIVQGLRQAGVPVAVLRYGDSAAAGRVARAEADEVVGAHLSFVCGLERKVVVWLQGDRGAEGDEGEGEGKGEGVWQASDEQYGRLYAMSRCTAQLVCVLLPARAEGEEEEAVEVRMVDNRSHR
ncbi:uncharacterized protein LOC143287758 [Babylonia areolata]|uniref:uncharacterized protein LOC143287758 n=1 Tax=Babylonia areolata TaxID=304850 RepID=UPI003FD1EF89